MNERASQHSSARLPAKTPPRRRFSEVLIDLRSGAEEQVTVGTILNAFGGRAFGPVLLAFAAPNLLPLPPGAPMVFAPPILFVATQLLLGRQVLWIPQSLRNKGLSRQRFATIADRLVPLASRWERFIRPRYAFAIGPAQDRLVGLGCCLLAMVLLLPIPFGNFLPAVGMVAFALGMTERDGLAVGVGWAVAALNVAILVGLGILLVTGAETLLPRLGGWFGGD